MLRVYPSLKPENVTVSDTSWPKAYRSLYVGQTGNVKVRNHDGSSCTLPNVQAGTLLPIECAGVYSTGTTVATPNTNIIGLY